MVTIIGIQYSNLSLFHLIFHAYFKALLFLTAGSIIHTILDIQDLRLTGGLYLFIPISYLTILIGLTSLSGFPFTTGFYSKESILNASSNYYLLLSEYLYLITLFTAFLTIAYSYRFIISLFFSTTRLSLFTFKNIHFFSLHLTLSLSLLAIFTLYIGYIYNKWVYLYNLPINFYNLDIPVFIKLLPLSFFIICYILFNKISYYFNINLYFLQSQYYFKLLYLYLSGTFLAFSYRILFKIFDYGILDLLSPIMGYQLYNTSKLISNYLTPSYYLSLILYFLYLIISST